LECLAVGKSSVSEGRPRIGSGGSGGHTPVMVDEVLQALDVRRGGRYIDATFGAGGHTRALLDAGAAEVVAIDRDPAAIARARALAAARTGVTTVEGRFGDMAELLAGRGLRRVEGIVLDLGISSLQLDTPGRGFSFAADGPLDMRMSGKGPTAADVVNQADAGTLAAILRRFGEEPAAGRIARAIVERRARASITRTRELADLVAEFAGGKSDRIHPATRTFQALRIHVNDELGELERALAAAEALLDDGGRLVVVAFHSLEDRIVKRFLFSRSEAAPRPSRHAPAAPRREVRWRLPSRRPLRPQPAEVAVNPRARSARLRWAERVAAEERDE
jgi:16S rRNA (cytosine1402-N4)-methyltransferase